LGAGSLPRSANRRCPAGAERCAAMRAIRDFAAVNTHAITFLLRLILSAQAYLS